MTARDEATQRQIDAAHPDRSTWLSANAGSGKTRVLTDRVARLLLARVDPQHILCLTYTKAAAGEMQNRLFRRLGAWTMLEEERLRAELRELGVPGDISAARLAEARRLFARAIETPGGIKIQTIHSFCAALLRRFPLEAGVTPQFTEMDDRSAALLRAEVIETLAAGPDAPLLTRVAYHHGGETLADLAGEVLRHREALAGPADTAALARLFGQPADLDRGQIERGVFLGRERALLEALVPALDASGPMDRKAGARLAAITTLDADALPELEAVFLTGKGAKLPFTAKLGGFPTKPCRAGLAALMPELDAFMERVEHAREARLALGAIEKTRALEEFAALFLSAYDAAKERRGWLDFDDLILRARDLLTDPDVAAWVLFRLDGGIDHILVDEAQDTSPVQWQVIERLAQDFFAGDGAGEARARTVFVVGDKKQSIYSFQGADPEEFDRMRRDFAGRMAHLEAPLQEMELEYSFRSSAAVLDAVDHTFAGHDASGFRPDQRHRAHKSDLPGRVDLWPYEDVPAPGESPPWYSPVDIRAENDPATVLARRIAGTIDDLVREGAPIPEAAPNGATSAARPITPGDVLILVQRRNALFHEIIRACKALDLPIAGADRLKVGAELAVRDLAALLSFLATPEDSHALAVALKSPLFGWTEAALYDLAQGRESPYLWAELRGRAADFPATMEVLGDLRNQTDYLRPYDLIERILTRHRGRANLLARLGPEAEDGIDALLAQALAYEQKSVDSLTGFLVWLETDEMEIKRQQDSAGDRIRVMTVHGAKGLEAPVVILPDTGKRRLVLQNRLARAGDRVLWRSGAEDAPRPLADADARAKAAEQAERDRLLYVAMTRAEKWLIVAAAGDKGSAGDTWYEKVEAGLRAAGAKPQDFAEGTGLRLEHGDWPAAPTEARAAATSAPAALPAHFRNPAPPVRPAPRTLSPSDLPGLKVLPGEGGLAEEEAKRRGRQIHRLLEFLPDRPRADWPVAAGRLLSGGPDAAAGAELAGLTDEAARVLDTPDLAPLFAPGALTEVAITADLAPLAGQRIHGTIDRLVMGEDRILAVDFKTNAVIPATAAEVPDGILRQMGAYAHALREIYPGRRIETAILWTGAPLLMDLPHDLVTRALAGTPTP